ncbi:hypothetical protein DNTS_024120 [Danionella cerebrum]|uniref:Uncharacterized protein n=1 Tax=Danionella cerebrum TaxID=2873325 RepID=A0A553N0B9_9TELE|nr:hypothetical protein DNTS_024120 [Danionella translucida]
MSLSVFAVAEEGTVCSWKAADYLFSADASSADTERIFYSRDYVRNNLTVFHSKFLSVCRLRKSVTSVPIGHYVLPPEAIQNEIRAVIGQYIWETEEQ